MTSKLLVTATQNVSSLISSVKNNVIKSISKFTFTLKWDERNKDYGDIYLQLFELDAVRLKDFIFVEGTPEVLDRLNSLDFNLITDFKHEKLFNDFSCTVYNEKYNVALTLYNSDAKHAVLTAHKIVKQSLLDVLVPRYLVSYMVFRTAVTQLMEDT